ncbi:ROK family protein [Mucisphaera calidilacus]|uniref:Glucokinase n=1 Tax=Mucisphaera calidilacus TaxID=2527982 RepID=A0A518BXY4_9BACT|nr:ROK family protein [Mucisphaera calidilacus]QDU71847.1 Glucokinase [Mucisphaera calidilacus]
MAKSALTLGVDLGGTNIQAGLLSAEGKLLARDSTKTKADEGAEAVLKRIVKLCDGILEAAGVDHDDVAGMGVGAPGALDVSKGVVIEAVNLRWNDFPLAKKLGEMAEMPVVIDNDVNVGAWGEYHAGAGTEGQDMLAVFIGTGIGGGLIINDRLYHGHFFTAGEIGHTTVAAHASIGRRTVENLASRNSMVLLIQKLIMSNHPSWLVEATEGDLGKIRSKLLAQAVKKQDPLAVEVVAHAAEVVGIAIANAVTLLSLPQVVVGGGLAEAMGDGLIKRIREAFDRHVFPGELKKCKLVASKLGDDAGVIGAALLARE